MVNLHYINFARKKWVILKWQELQIGLNVEHKGFDERNIFSECYFEPKKFVQVIELGGQ